MSATATPAAGRAARYGLWALPLYGVLLGLSTLTHQPPVDDFDAYARYVSTGTFLLSHLGASIFGAAAGIAGVVAVTAYLVRGPAARLAVAGLAVTVVAQVFMASAFGSAAFVQPGIGRAHLAGVPGMADLNADTAYGPALFAVALSATFALMVSAVLVGVAVARTDPRLRAPGTAYAVLLPLFAITGQAFSVVQPYTGFALGAATALLALRLPAVPATSATSAESAESVRQLSEPVR